MNTQPYNNPRVEKYYPIKGREDFFKFSVMEGDSIAEGYDNKPLIFQDEKEAQRIVKSRINCNKKTLELLKPNKYKYYKVIQQCYTTWEDITFYECDSSYNVINKEEFKGDLKAYRENQPQPIRYINRKELNPDYKTDN